jgi:DNA end-binding protein Ku
MVRAIWKGSLNFGLVTIPVQLVTAVRDRDVHFHLLDEDEHCRLRRKLVCPGDNREIPYNKTVLGFEVAPDQYVVVEKDELKRLKPESGRSIHITDFVNQSEVDPQFFDRPYHLVPDEGGRHAYGLLHAAMQRTGRAGIASLVMREKQYLALVRPLGKRLGLVTMRFADEIVGEADLPAPPATNDLPKRELDTAVQLVESMADRFQPEKYHDEYREKVLALIQQKSRGRTPRLAPSRQPKTRVINLMDALKASLAESTRGGSKSSARSRTAESRPRRKAS